MKDREKRMKVREVLVLEEERGAGNDGGGGGLGKLEGGLEGGTSSVPEASSLRAADWAWFMCSACVCVCVC